MPREIENSNLVVVDTETGGFDPHRHSILSIGIVITGYDDIIDTLEVNIKEPNIVAEKDSLEVNKIDLKEHVKNALPPEETVSEINNFIQKQDNLIKDDKGRAVIAGHNIFFDIDFMRRLYRLANSNYREYFSHRNLDTSTLLRFFYLTGKIPVKHSSLSRACDYYNITINNRHNALSDAIGTAKLLQKLYRIK